MNRRQKNLSVQLAALSPEDRVRLEQLSQLAEVAPEALFPDVLKYGFDDVEDGIRADLEAKEYFQANAGISHEEAIAEVRKLVGVHAGRKRQAS